MKNVLTSVLIDIIKEPTKHDQDYKVRLVEGALIADLVDAGFDDVPSDTWGSSFKSRELFIIDFAKFKGMAEDDRLKLHITYCASSSVSMWELSAYVLPKGVTSVREAKVHTCVTGTHPSLVLNNIATRLATVAEAAG
jgi:hypothetical protein